MRGSRSSAGCWGGRLSPRREAFSGERNASSSNKSERLRVRARTRIDGSSTSRFQKPASSAARRKQYSHGFSGE
eukprot:11216967-Lingulodinium_polyedra.AAC.1